MEKKIGRTKKNSRKRIDTRWGIIMLLPIIIGFAIFAVYPIIMSFVYSFFDWFGFREPIFIGLENFQTLLSDPIFWQTIQNTFRFAIVILPLSIIISLIISSCLNAQIRGKSIYRVIFYLPAITMLAAVSLVWEYMFHSSYGIINAILIGIGLEPVNWLGDPSTSWIVIALLTIWSMIGFQILILLAAMQSIPKSLYEAADIDGCGELRKFMKITVPMVSPSIFFLVITGFMGTFLMFDATYMMIQTGPGIDSTRTVMYYFYETAFTNADRGYASAIVVIVFFILTAFAAINFWLQKKWVHYDR